MILERYLKLIQSAVETEQAPIEDLEIVGRRELERLVEDWNRTEKRLTARRCIHELIAEQARLRPEAIAVVYQDEQLTYRGLESGPISWRIICERWGWGRSVWWGCTWRGRRR